METLLKVKNWSLRVRIFLAMILITIISSILIAGVSLVHFQIENQEYHQDRLIRKENQIKQHIQYVLEVTPHPLATFNLQSIFKDKIFEIADIHNIEIDIYDLAGHLIITSKAPIIKGQLAPNLSEAAIQRIKVSDNNRYVSIAEDEQNTYRFSYTYLMDYIENKPIGIIRLPYVEEDDFYKEEIISFLKIFGMVYLGMIVISIWIAYYLSRYITKSLKTISDRLTETSLTEKMKRLIW